MFDYFEKLKERSDKYIEKYSGKPINAAARLTFWNFVSMFRLIFDGARRKAPSHGSNALRVAFVLGGGMGDVIISALYVDRFTRRLDCRYSIALFVKQSVTSVSSMLHDHGFAQDIRPFGKLDAGEFDLVVYLDVQFPVVSHADMARLNSLSTFLPSYVKTLQEFRAEWGPVASKGGETFRQQHKCLIDGTTRITAMDVGGVLGIRHDDELSLAIPESGKDALKKFGLEGQRFIIIQRGVDAKRSSQESIKLWSQEKYEELVRLLKARWPGVTLVHVGVSRERCADIAGVDMDLVGQTSFAELMALEKEAILHIDGECGMVHLRHFLCRRPSVVLFGPTSPKVRGYSENINIRSEVCPCELCEWLIGVTWQSVCVRNGTPVADCMEAITPEMVMERIEEEAPRIFG